MDDFALPYRLITAAQMREAEQLAMQQGISGWQMMQAAGQAVAKEIIANYQMRPVWVLCGPGNNGGDGWVVAAHLMQHGWPVHVAATLEKDAYQGDAGKAAESYDGNVLPIADVEINEKCLVVDALFGTGLARPLEEEIAELVEKVNASAKHVVAVDVPSGIHTDSGEVMGVAIRAERTVTFATAKLGHALMPGQAHTGELKVVDIGINAQVADILQQDHRTVPSTFINEPGLWENALVWPQSDQHKYSRGAVVVRGGPLESTGASRLSAVAALRSGAGAVTLACDSVSLPIYARHLTSVMTREVDGMDDWKSLVSEPKQKALVLGPGNGVGPATVETVLAALATGKPTVLDADALTSFEGDEFRLFSAINGEVVLTPHEGEFGRLFSGASVAPDAGKLQRTRQAAISSKAVVVLKGADTVIAAPDLRAVVNWHAPSELATAGSGDVLAGIIAGLLASGMPTFEAACAGVWLHAEAARELGVGLIAEDLPDQLPQALKRLKAS